MEQSPSMSSTTLGIAKNTSLSDSNATMYPGSALEDRNGLSPEPPLDPELLESEMALVSSLAKLQKLEDMIHQLRTLLPERLLEPLAPVINPQAATQSNSPESPQKLLAKLSQAVRAGATEVGEFQSLWRGPEMKGVWERIDTLIYENAGQLLQPSGMWERDYETILEDITKQDTLRKEQQQRAQEDVERAQVQSTEGGWKAVVDSFAQDNSSLRILPTKNDSTFTVLLAKTGLAFKIHTVDAGQGNGALEWKVASRSATGETSKLQNAILDCLNTRPRQWDLTFLLEMMASYSATFQTKCVKCGNVQDKSANLPTIRRPKSTNSTNNSKPSFEAYHPACI
ncbi:mediator complex subunit 27-domain-containing protein [Aspergillus californicus]